MKLKSYHAETVEAATRLAGIELGESAVFLGSRKTEGEESRYEVTFAVPEPCCKQRAASASHSPAAAAAAADRDRNPGGRRTGGGRRAAAQRSAGPGRPARRGPRRACRAAGGPGSDPHPGPRPGAWAAPLEEICPGNDRRRGCPRSGCASGRGNRRRATGRSSSRDRTARLPSFADCRRRARAKCTGGELRRFCTLFEP